MSGLRPLVRTVPRVALPSTQIMSLPPRSLPSFERRDSANFCILFAIEVSSIPFSTRQSVASDGTPFLSMPIFRNLPRLLLPKSIMSTRPTRPDARANTIRISISRSRWRMFPLFDLRKSGTEEAKFTSSLRIVPSDSNLFVTFARRLSADLSAMVKWFGFFIIIRFFFLNLLKIHHLTKFLYRLFG